ncbi:hypothetical protein ABT282_30925 [Streptomyces sp. NPDC000927]|uniref:hypothetical protein n=1 Tax=Streptomyces sp. NPDC000927 TaxID=3154371 RepID=UPI00331BBDFC
MNDVQAIGPVASDKKARNLNLSQRRVAAAVEIAKQRHLSLSGLFESLLQMLIDGDIKPEDIKAVPALPPLGQGAA